MDQALTSFMMRTGLTLPSKVFDMCASEAESLGRVEVSGQGVPFSTKPVCADVRCRTP